MPGKGARARGKEARKKKMKERKLAKQARFLAQRDAGKKKRAEGVTQHRLSYTKSMTKPGTAPNHPAKPGVPGTGRNRPAKYFDQVTREWQQKTAVRVAA